DSVASASRTSSASEDAASKKTESGCCASAGSGAARRRAETIHAGERSARSEAEMGSSGRFGGAAPPLEAPEAPQWIAWVVLISGFLGAGRGPRRADGIGSLTWRGRDT